MERAYCAVCCQRKAKPPHEVCWLCAQRSREEREQNRIHPDFREWLLDRDGRRCVECGETGGLEIDHIVPVLHGGKTAPDNLQVLCADCNLDKGSDASHSVGLVARLAEPPLVTWQPLISEFGLILAILLSEVMGRSATSANVRLSAWTQRLGLPSDVILFHLRQLEEAGLVMWVLDGDLLSVTVWGGLVWKNMRLLRSSTRRHPTTTPAPEDRGPKGSSTGRPGVLA